MSSREQAIMDELNVEYAMFTHAIEVLIAQGLRFSPEAARLANERSQVRLAINRLKIEMDQRRSLNNE